MNRQQAIKTIAKCVDYYVKKRLAFDANAYQKGFDNEHAKKCYLERKKICEAMDQLAKQESLL